MSTPNTGAYTPESASQAPQEASMISSLTKKIMTALAAIGLTGAVTQNADGAITITPVSGPTFQPNSSGMLSNQFS